MAKYCIYKDKRILETDISKDNTEILLNKVTALQSGSQQSTKNFTNYIRKEYGISNELSFSAIIKKILQGAVTVGSGYGILYTIDKIFKFGYNAMKGIALKFGLNLTTIGGNDYSFYLGSLWWLVPAVIACFVVIILCKIMSWAMAHFLEENYNKTDTNLMNLYSELTFKKTIIQSNKLIDQLKYTTGLTNIKEGDIQEIKKTSVRSIIAKAVEQSIIMVRKITQLTKKFLYKYRKLIIVTLVCIGLVLSFKNLQAYAKTIPAKVGSGWESFKNSASGIGNTTIIVRNKTSGEITRAFIDDEAKVRNFLLWCDEGLMSFFTGVGKLGNAAFDVAKRHLTQ